MSTDPEFSRPVRLDTLSTAPRTVEIAADDTERAALAARFGLLSLAQLEATADVTRDGDRITATGTIAATAEQACIATGEPVPANIAEPFALLFLPQPEDGTDDEVELAEGELDTIFYQGGAIDLGEAVAETLALALDPFPRAAGADAALRDAGVISEADAEAERAKKSPFAVLKKD